MYRKQCGRQPGPGRPNSERSSWPLGFVPAVFQGRIGRPGVGGAIWTLHIRGESQSHSDDEPLLAVEGRLRTDSSLGLSYES